MGGNRPGRQPGLGPLVGDRIGLVTGADFLILFLVLS